MNEMRESCKILKFCVEHIPKGLIKVDNKKITPPSRFEMKNSMEALIHHFKSYSQGLTIPKNRTYVGTEAPKGEFGIFLISSGINKPYRCKIKAPGFHHIHGLNLLTKGSLLADVVTVIGTLDVVFGEIDR
jgi:NADH:ubiquinone oxidoreductase subunit D